jgi:hypothetical protein
MDAAVAGLPVSSPQPTQLTFEDGLGERRYAIGALNEPLEVLKLSSVLGSVSSFDFALRERGARLSGFRHDAYARVRAIELDRRTSALVITSDYTQGIRLSTILADAHKRSIPIEINAVRCIVRQLVSAAAALQESAPDVANGAIALERLIITPSGRLVIAEYVLGAALEQLAYSRARYWRELGIALPAVLGPPLFDARADVTQIGVITLSLILGRPLAVDEYPERLSELIENATLRSVMGSLEPLPTALRDWLLQALQLDQWESFGSPADAQALLDEAFGNENAVAELGALQIFLTRYASSDLPVDDDIKPRLEAMKAFLARYPSRRTAAPTVVHEKEREQDKVDAPARAPEPEPAAKAPEPEPPAAEPEPEAHFEFTPITAAGFDMRGDHSQASIPSYAEDRRSATPVTRRHRLRILAAIGGLLILVGGGAAAWYFRTPTAPQLGTLSVGTEPPGIQVFVDGAPQGVTPLRADLPPGEHVVELRTDTERRRIPVTIAAGGQVSQYFELARPSQSAGELLVRTDPLGAAVTVDGKYVGRSPVSVADLSPGTHTVVMQSDAGTLTERVLVESGRTASLVVSMGGAAKNSAAGWIRLDVPAEVQVLENGRRLGSSDLERIMLPVGRHELEFVNDALGYREQRAVQISAGQTASVRLDWPRGSMAINATPWAEVFVDGTRVGETPIGNITTPIGTHDVVFRHPELGERRLSVTVKTGDPLKVGVDLRTK